MKTKRRIFKDRKDARRCDDVLSMNQICIDLKPRRSLGELYINEKFDITNLVNYIDKQREKGKKITYFHSFATLIGKTLYNRPLLNRFVANRHMYEHNNVSISFVMKVEFSDRSEEIMVIMPIEEKDNIFTISEKISNKVNSIREKGDTGSGANNAIKILAKLPNFLRVPILAIFKLFDKWGILPSSLVEDNLYYSSLILSNVGTFKCNGIYHNVTDFGTCSGIVVMGEVKEEIINKEKKYFCEFGLTFDERVADGFYFIKSLKLMQYIFNNPELLEGDANEKIEIKEEK